jgi:hypothetical protein
MPYRINQSINIFFFFHTVATAAAFAKCCAIAVLVSCMIAQHAMTQLKPYCCAVWLHTMQLGLYCIVHTASCSSHYFQLVYLLLLMRLLLLLPAAAAVLLPSTCCACAPFTPAAVAAAAAAAPLVRAIGCKCCSWGIGS